MSANAWVTRDDVLKDLKEVNGRNTGAQYLEQYVVRGEAPPPVRPELTNDDEIQRRFYSGPGTLAGDDFTPDLKGISRMLQMVDDLDDPRDSGEIKTFFKNTTTDEICISKLNPQVDEFVPGRANSFKLHPKTESSKKIQLETLSNLNKKGPMLIKKSDKLKQNNERFCENGHSSTKPEKILSTKELSKKNDEKPNRSEPIETKDISDLPTRKSPANISTSIPSSSSKTAFDHVGDISLDKKLDITQLKCDEITKMKEKIKSKIINSSREDSLQHKREKNVAIATLLKLCSAKRSDADKSVKLVTPDYFEVPPTPIDKKPINDKVTVIGKEVEQIPETSSRATVNQYVDPLVQESISKVNDWFNYEDKPKPKPQSFSPVRQPIALKNKTSSSPSITSTPSSEKKKSCGDFVPSSYASDLLQKYETNSRKKIAPKEDLGTMLEHKLKERDQQIKKKLLEKKETLSPGSGRSVQ